MAEDLMNYNKLVEAALRGVVRTVLQQTAQNGLPGSHHFYIGFRTAAPDVEIPEYLKTRYPDEMTIVVQHQFWGLEIDDEWFEITLSFNKRQERLHIPFAAITSFFDPSVQFGLQFQPAAGAVSPQGAGGADKPEEPAGALPAPPTPTADGEAPSAQNDTGDDNVVPLDQFRKK